MFQLDDQFLSDVGLAGLPEEEKKPFLQLTYKRLEYQVGVKLSEGMTDEQFEEFEAIISQKPDVVSSWLMKYAPDFQNDSIFQRLQQASGLDASSVGLQAEYAATKWLEVNRPDYRDVVAQTLAAIKEEIMRDREAILSGGATA